MTYGDILSKFKHQHPEIEVDDYRPAGASNEIVIWTNDGETLLVQYVPIADRAFIIARQPTK